MMPSRLLLGLWLVALAARGEEPATTPAPATRPGPHVFVISHRPVEEAYRVIEPLLSAVAEVKVVKGERRLEVLDAPERLEAVARALEAFDVAPRAVRLLVRVVRGERRPAAEPGADSGTLLGVPRDVREMFGYNAFESLGSVELQMSEGGVGQSTLGPDDTYRVEVELGAVDGKARRLAVKSLTLVKKYPGGEGHSVYRPLMSFSEDLQIGRPRVLCATASTSHRKALFLLVLGSVD